MSEEKWIAIPKARGVFINKQGLVMSTANQKELLLRPFRQGEKRSFVMLGKKWKAELVYLMIECFGLTYNPTDRLTYSTTAEGWVPLNGIKITPVMQHEVKNLGSLTEDDILLSKYNCKIKAKSANAKGIGIISSIEILNILKRQTFLCFYCADLIIEKKWHLDHYMPIYLGGKTHHLNMVASCPVCNMMKYNVEPGQFILKCRRIAHIHQKEKKPNVESVF